jgi:hypothetical protein
MTERWQQHFNRARTFDSKWLSAAVSHWGFNEILYGMIQKYSLPRTDSGYRLRAGLVGSFAGLDGV